MPKVTQGGSTPQQINSNVWEVGGNLGVGSTHPGQALDVSGTVRATAFQGDGTGITGISGTGGWTHSSGLIYPTTLTDNVGIGTNQQTSRLQVMSGGTQTELVNKTWERIPQDPNAFNPGASFVEVNSMAVYKGYLYLGYNVNSTGGNHLSTSKIYRWDGNTMTFMSNIGSDSHFLGVAFIQPYNGKLYAGIQGSAIGDGDVYVSSDDGVTWSKSYENTTDDFMYSAAVFKGKLYTGQGFHSGFIYSFDGTTWSTAYNTAGTGSLILSLKVFNGRLYAATGGGVSDILSTADGINWTVEATYPTATYAEFNLMEEFRGKLYADVIVGVSGTNDVLVRDNTTGTWSVAVSALSGGQGWGMLNYNDALYVGCTNTATSAILYKTLDGTNFVQDFQTPISGSFYEYEAFRAIAYNGSMYFGFGSHGSTGANMWRKTDSLGQLFDTDHRFVNNFRYNTTSTYPFNNDASLINLSSPINFENNVGVSSTNPQQKIDVQGTVRATAFQGDGSQLTGIGGGGFTDNGTYTYNTNLTHNVGINTIAPGSSLTILKNSTNDYFHLNSSAAAGGNIVAVKNSGNVGIGSNNPGQLLDIAGTTRQTGFTLSGNGAASGFMLQASSSVGIGTWVPAPTGGGTGTVTSVTLATPSSTLTLGGTNPVTTSGTINADINLTNANTWTGQQIFNTANVGIASSAPGQKLDVQGTIRASTDVKVGTLSLCRSDGTNCPAGGVNYWITGNVGINTTNNVGIGTINPGTALDVNGTIRASSGLQINGLGSGQISSPNNIQFDPVNATFTTPTVTLIGSNVGIGTVTAPTLATFGSTGQTNIDSNGNVGLGTTKTTTSALTVMSGNVGIGTWVPTTNLQVVGSEVLSGTLVVGTVQTNGSSTQMTSNGYTASSGYTTSAGFGGAGNSLTTGAVFSGSSSSANMTTGTIGILTYSGANRGNTLQLNSTNAAATGPILISTNTSLGPSAVFTGTGNINIGIGTITPLASLGIVGNIGIGTIKNGDAYLINSPPNGGLIVEGNVGIGTITPGQKLDVQGNVRISTVGSTIGIVSGSNSCHGTAALSSGTVTVSTTCAPSLAQNIFLTDNGGGVLANIGSLYVGTVTGGTSFIINSSNALDSSNVGWIIIN